ncbi:MAG: hypothetical protein DWQ07_13370 [Chloroflexi bacterium]|nr:MAG: hypothetical protein DWQ07_13370 [Chloroflexota bacterium]MBL1196774.1 hypothetical protein [Chloroflexota bacterium]NOH14068.1 hypothetical protein [Chloroflexota bacterium]
MNKRHRLITTSAVLAFAILACGGIDLPSIGGNDEPEFAPILEGPASDDPNEPVYITGTIPFTSPFFLDGNAEPFVLLEDQAGFVARDREYVFPLEGQAIGPVELIDESTLSFSLALPAVPQGTLLDVDQDGEEDRGVMIFQVAYWSNTWGGPFLEERDGRGWSGAYTTAIVDGERDGEIEGGHLMIWAPDDQQMFPSGFGADNMLFTEDDPLQAVPAGYNIVDLNQDPFLVYKEAQPQFELLEGSGAVKDYIDLSYEEAFDRMFEQVSVEYPFTAEKNLDWQAIYDEFAPRVADANNDNDFYRALRDFTYAIPDAHVFVSFNPDVFFEEQGGSFGLVLKELSDGRVIVTQVLPGTTGSQEGILVGAEIIEWDGQAVSLALDNVDPYLGPYSTEHARRQGQAVFLTRYPPNTQIQISYQNPGESETTASLTADIEYDTLFESIPSLTLDELALPVTGEILDESGLGYIQVTTFSDDYNLMARVWDRYIQNLIDNEIPGLIIDLRINGGGSSGLAGDFLGYFFEEEFVAYQRAYYNDDSGKFEYTPFPTRVQPGPLFYDGDIAVLVGPDCASACEGFAYSLASTGRATIIGHFPSGGLFGEVGQGQYTMPGDYSMQFPTGRPEDDNGDVVIEGVGVVPDIVVPVTEDSALGIMDAVLQAAIDALSN